MSVYAPFGTHGVVPLPLPTDPEGSKPTRLSFGEEPKPEPPKPKISLTLPVSIVAMTAIYFLV